MMQNIIVKSNFKRLDYNVFGVKNTSNENIVYRTANTTIFQFNDNYINKHRR